MTQPADYARWAWCGLDFVRALNERPLWAKIMFRIVCGRYAYREFTLMVNNIQRDGYDAFHEYGLEGCDYHNAPMRWEWWEPEFYERYDAASQPREEK